MRKKLIAIFVMLLITFSTIVIIPNDLVLIAEASPDEEDVELDYQFIYNITENLSNVIFDAYEEGELRKGRAFGSKGELYAAKYIEDVMNEIGLSNVQLDNKLSNGW